MVEAFGGVLNLVIWLLLIVAGGYYAYRCLLQTKGFIDQYGFLILNTILLFNMGAILYSTSAAV